MVWLRDGVGMVGEGGWTVTLTGERRLPRLAALWREIAAGHAGVLTAFVSSVFDDRSRAATVLRIPHRLQRRTEAGADEITQSLDEDRLRAAVQRAPGARLDGDIHPPPGATLSPAGYERAVREALARIAAGDVAKVVLSLDEFIPADDATCRGALAHLSDHYPGCWTFAVG
ncbi:MAG TPA: hypothetical protein VK024_09550, partial [Actinomycetaceae bacterium]|nr:hypothetical protein [Actinomycetaceae bacterium]